MAETALAVDRSGVAVPEQDLGAWAELLARLDLPRIVSEAGSARTKAALDICARPGFDTLVCLPWLRFEPFPYQLAAASRTLRHLRGRAILADEVGLGKTIEAGIVLSELRLRQLATRTLVLTPAGLVGQWQEELEGKFGLPSVLASSARAGEDLDGPGAPVVLASLATARRRPLSEALARRPWDLVVVDEAHRARNPQSSSARLVKDLTAHYLLLLTATPVENRIEDLYQLVNLVRPGHLGTQAQFRTRHGRRRAASAGGSSPPRELTSLRARLGDVMVRHRRSEISLMLPRRLAETRRLHPGPAEAALYQAVSERVRLEGRSADPTRRMSLRSAQRLAGSSPAALTPTLAKVGWGDLAEQAAALERTAKTRALVEVVGGHVARGDKVVVFTAFRRNLDGLVAALRQEGVDSVAYHGSLSHREKDGIIAAFSGLVPVMVATEAAGEGRNLQFCHTMVIYELPWNTMQIEHLILIIHLIV
ncbi:MAG: DEAD/DEAH box helicase, partial [Acidimicrobiales bacterium]